jgi:TRAP-type mannitol/chloroaromatic compound transport system permease small subunit
LKTTPLLGQCRRKRSPEGRGNKTGPIVRATGENDVGALLSLSAVIDRINEFIGKTVSWLILAAVLVSATNAIIRKAFNSSSNAWLELQWYLFGAAFLLAAAYTLKQNEHIRIDIVYGLWCRRTQHWIDLFGHLVFLMPFCLLMLYMLTPWAMHSFRIQEVSNNAGGLILWPVKALLPLGFLLLMLQGISEIIKKIAVMRGVIPDPTPFVSAHASAEIEARELAGQLEGGVTRK